MPQDSKPARKPVALAKPSGSPDRPANPLPPADGPQTEAELNSPTRQTVGLLALLAIATVTIWLLGERACNYHPKRETRRPREVTTQQLAGSPKDAAMEMQQRWATGRYAEALELAQGAVAQELTGQAARCDANPSGCKQQRSKTRGTTTTATLLAMSPPAPKPSALVRTTTIGPDGQQQRFRMVLVPEAGIWKVTSRTPDKGEPLEGRWKQGPARGKTSGAAGAGGSNGN